MQEKARKLETLFHGDHIPPESMARLKGDTYEFEDYAIMKEFRGTHPAVMRQRIAQSPRFGSRRNRWLNPRFYKAIVQRGFRG